MGRNDWAIVIGIQSYFDTKGLAALEGSENDASAFYTWVTSPDGGAVPQEQAALIVSSAFKPPFNSQADAMPTAEAIKLAFDHLKEIADENDERGLGLSVGDRLYIFMAGHGFAPSLDDQLTALLTAEASVTTSELNHVVGSYMADWFWRATYFKQVFLFVDCCRTPMECTQLFHPYTDLRGRDYHKVPRFYAYGARVAKESREWKRDGKTCHGVFTMTLLNGLSGAASDPNDPQNITVESLSDYLYTDFKNFMVPEDRRRDDVPNEPEVDYEHRPGKNFVIAPAKPKSFLSWMFTAKPPQFPVRVRGLPGHIGVAVEIQDWTFTAVRTLTLQQTSDVTLERGTYLITGPGIQVTFDVTGQTGVVDVTA